MRCHLTTRSDDEEIWDELTSEVNRVAKCSDKMMAKASGGYPVKLYPANVCHAVNFITSGKAETVVQVSKWG